MPKCILVCYSNSLYFSSYQSLVTLCLHIIIYRAYQSLSVFHIIIIYDLGSSLRLGDLHTRLSLTYLFFMVSIRRLLSYKLAPHSRLPFPVPL